MGRDIVPNSRLAASRKALLSPSGSGRAMSRQELADACNAELARMYKAPARQRWAGMTEKTIGALERGEIRWPNEDYRAALCTVLGTDERSLGFYIDRPAANDLPVEPSIDFSFATAGSQISGRLGRRTFLTTALPVAGFATMPSAFLWSAASESLNLAHGVPTGYAGDTLASARDGLREAATDYVHTSNLPNAAAGALKVRTVLSPLMDRRLPLSEAKELYLLHGAACLLLASVSHDFGESAAGMMQADAAEHFAMLAEHPELLGWVRCTKAMIDLWRDRPESALVHAVGRTASNRADSYRLQGLEIRALAQLGRKSEAKHRLQLLEGTGPSFPPAGELSDLGAMFTFPEGRQKYYSAVSYSLLGERDSAEQYVAELGFLDGPPNGAKAWPISWALSRSYLALARLDAGAADGGPEAAADALAPVLTMSEGQRISQLAQVFRALGNRLSVKSFHQSSAAISLSHEVQNFLGGALRQKERTQWS